MDLTKSEFKTVRVWASCRDVSPDIPYIRDVPQTKNAALIWAFSIRALGPIQKFWGTFLCLNNFGLLGRKEEGGFDQIQTFWSTFPPTFW